jgi:release factor glutamine methyltransferase
MLDLDRLPPHEVRRLRQVAARHPDPEKAFRELTERRLAGEPLQYLEGTAAFGPLELEVDQRVLIPRPETERLYELVVELVTDPDVVVDLGTGSGALALALKHRFGSARVVATDISPDALEVASANAERLGLQVEFRLGDLFSALPADLAGQVGLLVSNPPYVAESEWESLPADVRREPRVALVAGPRGTEVLARIARGAADWLRPGGLVACEIGETQGQEALELFGAALSEVRVAQDLTGRDRYLLAWKT